MRSRSLRLIATAAAAVLVLSLCASVVSALSCDGSCSGHGACDGATGRCSCFPGYVGVSCKSMACPTGAAWVDSASAVDTAHAPAECSNMGACDRTSGQCKCAAGFEGAACERMSCPPCANGRCVSLRDAAQIQDNTNFFVQTTYSLWDADKIFGCQCDIGFTGWDCSQRACPKGDDPMTTTQTANEVQLLDCRCDGCTGGFSLTFRRRTTRNLLPTETAATLQAALEALDSIERVTVAVSGAAGAPICSATGTTTAITFTNNPGNLPNLQLQSRLAGGATAPAMALATSGATGTYDNTVVSVDGTREEAYCSNRGICDLSTGLCACYSGFTSSDGAGAAGTRGDCGVGVATICPTTSNGPCDGRGLCSNAPPYTCTCIAGFTGADCTQRTCPTGAAWFDEPTATDTAHALAVCSNKGACDAKTGLCACQAPFSGAACDVLKCPSGSAGVCNGHGTCRTMQQLALAATTSAGDARGVTYDAANNNAGTWDYNKIQGCDCTPGFYMGPYSSAYGEFRDYDCASKFCPVGADPYETGKVNEVQTLSCVADGGAFTLTFRTQQTAAIAFSADAATLQAALEALSSVTAVAVAIGGGATAVCSAPTAVVTTIAFTYEFGDLPPLTASVGALTLAGGTPTLGIAETQKGTKASLECSSRGLCDRAMGVCKCFNYFLSSDGAGNVGVRGDCGALSSYPTIATA